MLSEHWKYMEERSLDSKCKGVTRQFSFISSDRLVADKRNIYISASCTYNKSNFFYAVCDFIMQFSEYFKNGIYEVHNIIMVFIKYMA